MADPSFETPPVIPDYYAPQGMDIVPRNIVSSGTLPGNTVLRIGEKNLVIDGTNRRIMMNDDTNDRLLEGYQSGGF